MSGVSAWIAVQPWRVEHAGITVASEKVQGERIIRYYEERAAGGVGIIIMGVGAIAYPAGACTPNQVAISDDKFVPGLKKLADAVHAHGAKIAIQLQHAGGPPHGQFCGYLLQDERG